MLDETEATSRELLVLHTVASQVQLVSKLHILSQISPTLNAAAPVAIQDFSI